MTTFHADPREFLRQLEQQPPQPQTAPPRRRLPPEQLPEMIRAERVLASERGQEWTNWRKFHCVEEAVSPARSLYWTPHYRDSRCTVIATWVSYHTRQAERVYLCSGHFADELTRAQETS